MAALSSEYIVWCFVQCLYRQARYYASSDARTCTLCSVELWCRTTLHFNQTSPTTARHKQSTQLEADCCLTCLSLSREKNKLGENLITYIRVLHLSKPETFSLIITWTVQLYGSIHMWHIVQLLKWIEWGYYSGKQ